MKQPEDVVDIHFRDEMERIEEKTRRAVQDQSDFHAIFGGTSDDLFAYLTKKGFSGYPATKAALPDYPSEEISADCTGNHSIHEAIRETLAFWRLAKEINVRYGTKPLTSCKFVDFGAGWGRMTRFAAKDIPSMSVFAVEPNRTFCQIFEDTRVPGTLVPSDFLSEQALPIAGVDLMISFSIMTHASDRLAHNIRDRWAEMMTPGGVLVFTIRPGTFLMETDGEMAKFTPTERADAQLHYRSGELVYKAYADSPDWGITITPTSYLRRLFEDEFRIIGPHLFFQNYTQLPIIMIRK
jgi:hypothetical protein